MRTKGFSHERRSSTEPAGWRTTEIYLAEQWGVLPWEQRPVEPAKPGKESTKLAPYYFPRALYPLPMDRMCHWLGLPKGTWNNLLWRKCLALRYRWGEVRCDKLLNGKWRRRIDACLNAGPASLDNHELVVSMMAGTDRESPVELVAAVYSLTDVLAGTRIRTSVGEPAFWEGVARLRSDMKELKYWKYLAVPDGSSESLVGKVLYLFDEFEERSESIPDAIAGDPATLVRCLSSDPSRELRARRQDIEIVEDRLIDELGVDPAALRAVVCIWSISSTEESFRHRWVQGRAIHWLAAIFEGLDSELFSHCRSTVDQFRQEVIRPYLAASLDRRRSPVWQFRREMMRAQLADNPLLNCVLHDRAFADWVVGVARRSHGRPPRVALGTTVAIAVDQLRRGRTSRSSLSVRSAFEGVQFDNPQVRNAADQAEGGDAYSVLAVLLTALDSPTDEFYRASQLKELHRSYRQNPDRKRLEKRLSELMATV